MLGSAAVAGVTARIIWPSVRPKVLGHFGEAKVRRILNSFKSKEYAAEHDILIKGGRETTQIDHVLISRHGIFVVETKNYSGQIYGAEHLKDWTQTFSNGQHRTFLNPLLQNKTHAKAIQALLSKYPNVPIHSIVAFGDKCSMPAIPGVIKISDLKLAIKARSSGPPVLSGEEVQDIKSILRSAVIDDCDAREQHDIKAHLAAEAARHVTPEMMAALEARAKTSELLHFGDKPPQTPQLTPEQTALTDTGARLTIRGRTASIEDFFETAKRDASGKLVPRGANFDHFICPYTGDSFPASEAKSLYQGLWVAYLNKNPELVEYLHVHIAERPGATFRCQKLLAAYEKDPQGFTAQARNCIWYRNVVRKLQQKKQPLNDQIRSATGGAKAGTPKEKPHQSYAR